MDRGQDRAGGTAALFRPSRPGTAPNGRSAFSRRRPRTSRCLLYEASYSPVDLERYRLGTRPGMMDALGSRREDATPGRRRRGIAASVDRNFLLKSYDFCTE